MILDVLSGVFESLPKDSLNCFSQKLFSRLFNYHITGSKSNLKYNLPRVSAFLFLVRFTNEIQEEKIKDDSPKIEMILDQIIRKCLEDLPNNENLTILIKTELKTCCKDFWNVGKSINFGKIFQSLIPLQIRKHIAAYYTKPESARLLASLASDANIQKIADFACGAGILLQESLRALFSLRNPVGSKMDHATNPAQQISKDNSSSSNQLNITLFGSDILQSAILLTKLNLQNIELLDNISINLMFSEDISSNSDSEFKSTPRNINSANIVSFNLMLSDALSLKPDTDLPKNTKLGLFDLIIENPPFTRTERISQTHHNASIETFVNSRGLKDYYSKRMGLQSLFLMHADSMLKDSGTLAFVLPANIFNIDTKSYLQIFFKDKQYWIEYVISLGSDVFSFSEDCSYKEFLFIAKKGQLTASSMTKFVQISNLPALQSCDSVAKAILSSQIETITAESVEISINQIKTIEILTSNNKWDIYFWKSDTRSASFSEITKNENLIALSESKEYTVRVGFHSTYSDFLIFPNKLFEIAFDSSNHDRVILTRKEDYEEFILPSKLFASSLREPKLYTSFICNSEHFVYVHSDDVDNTDKKQIDKFLGYLTKKLKETHRRKIERGLRTPETLEEKWFEHPVKTGACSKKAHLFTFNRYGLWKRTNLCVYIRNNSTANDGFHLYSYIGKDLDEQEALLLLCSWFNCSLHIFDFLMKCRVPAKHVQQVALSDRMKMLVPKIEVLDKKIRDQILENTQRLNEKSSLLITEQLRISERKALDLLWMDAIGIKIDSEKKQEYLERLYSYLGDLLANR